MENSNTNNPILVTGANRSGSAIIARIFELAGAYAGKTNKMYETAEIDDLAKLYIRDNSIDAPFPRFDKVAMGWKEYIDLNLNLPENDKWMLKGSLLTQTWKNWHLAYPDAKWIIVRRRTADIVNSCMRTGYMTLFKSEENRNMIGARDEREAWTWWINQYELEWGAMFTQGLNCKVIWPERMVTGDYRQIYEMLEWVGLRWTPAIPSTIHPLLKSKQ